MAWKTNSPSSEYDKSRKTIDSPLPCPYEGEGKDRDPKYREPLPSQMRRGDISPKGKK